MGVFITGRYLGDKLVSMRHEYSGAEILTDAPLDNNGKARYFSPTDLFAASFGTCMLTVMAIFAERSSIDLNGSHFELEKEMAEKPRRIAAVKITFHLPKHLDEKQRLKLENTAKTCPVTNTLGDSVQKVLSFNYDV